MSKANSNDVLAFAIRHSDLDTENLGCNKFTPLLVELKERLSKSKYSSGVLSDWATVNPRTIIPDFNEGELASFLPMDAVSERTGNVVPRQELFSKLATGYTRFAEDDVLWAKITPCMQNGKSCVARSLIHGVGFGSTEFHVIRSNQEEVLPEYIWSILSLNAITEAAQAVFTGSAGQQRVPESFLNSLPFPKPPIDIQKRLSSRYLDSIQSRDSKLSEAKESLENIDVDFLRMIGADIGDQEYDLSYAVRSNVKNFGKHLDADYFHPERMVALRAIEMAKNAKEVKPLSSIVDFRRDIEKFPDPEQYVGLANVESNTGELIDSADPPGEGQSLLFQKDDVLFARLRPYLNKVWRADTCGVCSPEFHVMRIKPSSAAIHPDYLAAVLRSSLIVAQTKHMMTGNTHPRLTHDDIVDLLVPIPEQKLQIAIVAQINQRSVTARQLRIEAEEEWLDSKLDFEQIIFEAE